MIPGVVDHEPTPRRSQAAESTYMNSTLNTLLGLKTSPVAISFVDQAPAGIPHVARAEAAGCGYWRRAAEGQAFYTEAADHLNCAVGAHTHNVPMGPEKQEELKGLIGTMVGLSYLTMADVPKIPQRKTALRYAVYAPLAEAVGTPSVVMIRGDVRQLMLLSEAAQAAGIGSTGPTMGRPTCAVIPEAINGAHASASFGCVGNRVYTGASDNEGYFAIPGEKLAALETSLAVAVRANAELEKFHRARLQTI